MSGRPANCEVAYIPRKLLEYLLSLRTSPLITQSVNELVDQTVVLSDVHGGNEPRMRTYFTKCEPRVGMASLYLSKKVVDDLRFVQHMIGHVGGINVSMSDVLVGAIVHQLRDLDSSYWEKPKSNELYGCGVQHIYIYQWLKHDQNQFIVAEELVGYYLEKKNEWRTILSRP